MSKKILCLDFDGVLHSYKSGWQGARVISDPPVPGALQFVADALGHFDVCILSSRSHQFLGRRAMRRWLFQQYCDLAPTYETMPPWLLDHLRSFADSWEDQVRWDMKALVDRIGFPKHKPPAFLTIDDRVMLFTGEWPTMDEIEDFSPWTRRKESWRHDR